MRLDGNAELVKITTIAELTALARGNSRQFMFSAPHVFACSSPCSTCAALLFFQGYDMSEAFYDLTESYQNLRRDIETVEKKFEELPSMREQLHELAERIKAYVSDPGLEPAEEPEPIEPMTDLAGVDYAPAFEGYQPNGSLPETD